MSGEKAHPEHAREQPQASESRLQRAQAVAQVGIWELDLATRVLWASDEAFRLYGLTRTADNNLPLALVQSVPLPEHRARLDDALAALRVGQRPYDIEYQIRRPSDGAIRHIHSLAEVARDVGGRPTTVLGTLQDITESKAAAAALAAALERSEEMFAALKASEERARMIFEQAADAILVADAQGRIMVANQRAVELTGYSREELSGRSFGAVFSSAVLDAAPLRFDLLERGDTVVRERVAPRKDGSMVTIEMRSRKLPDGTYQTILRDLTDSKRLEEQLLLRQRMDSIGTLTSGIAHDFNNILAAVMGFADMLDLDRDELTEEQVQNVEGILQAAQRGADLVHGLQTLTRPRGEDKGCFDLAEVAAEAFRVLEQTTNRVVAKQLRIDKGAFWLRGNESDIYHALMNLGVNAVQAIEEKGAVQGDLVWMEACDCAPDLGDSLGLKGGAYVHVAFGDTGIGMTSEVRQRVFDPLFTTKAKGPRKGQGLGLTMVYKIVVDRHGGHIHIETAPGAGTVFHLYLPKAAARPEGAAVAAQARLARGHETILVVEDEPLLLDLTRRTLEHAGYRVLTAEDGARAIEVFREAGASINLVLLDRTLPKQPGAAVMRQIRAMRPDIKVIVTSGDSFPGEVEFPTALRFLEKPYLPRFLCRVVREALDAAP
jgi:two-component system, cell cycle sensor histidine kinase and response regulator CckA